ncbi:MAG: hypothetical protein H7249_16725 [Chitinophagaceae bacterium]|nr:hypothetical protein [Oligoflexus sp.]
MKNFLTLIFSGLLTHTAFATTIAPVDVGMCTRDFNPWGHSSMCSCPHATRYDLRIGRCVQGAPVEANQLGVISKELAIGGETSGAVLNTDEGQKFELILSRQASAQLEDPQNLGQKYQISGEILEVEGLETATRPTIIVDALVPVAQ